MVDNRRKKMVRKCKVCGSDNYYAKGMCRNCYAKMKAQGLKDADEVAKYVAQKKRNKAIKERAKHRITLEQMKVRSTNEFIKRPWSIITKTVMDWYYDSTDKYLIMEFDTPELKKSAYNSIYAMSKRRHELPVKRYQRGNAIIVERIA